MARIGNNALVSKSLSGEDEPALRSLSRDGTGRMNRQRVAEFVVRTCGTVQFGEITV